MSESGQYFVCPFCSAKLAYSPWPMSAYDYAMAEEQLSDHLLSEHPIRWRLSRKFRKVVKNK